MIFPLKNDHIGYAFGAKTSYGYHGGIDYNGEGAGDSDLGLPIFCIAEGEVTSIHEHPNKYDKQGKIIDDWGKHLHYKIEGPWGVRYIHYAHCQEILVKSGEKIKEGQIIARVGKTGTSSAHLHWEIKKVSNHLDSVPKTKPELDSIWEDPEAFIKQWKDYTVQVNTDEQNALSILKANRFEGNLEATMRTLLGEHNDLPGFIKLKKKLIEVLKLPTDSGHDIVLNEVLSLLATEDAFTELSDAVDNLLKQPFENPKARIIALQGFKDAQKEEVSEIKEDLETYQTKVEEWHKKKNELLLTAIRINIPYYANSPKFVIKIYKEEGDKE